MIVRTFEGMSDSERNAYMNMLGQTTQCIVPEDAKFFILVFRDNEGKFVTNADDGSIIGFLRQHIEDITEESPEVADGEEET